MCVLMFFLIFNNLLEFKMINAWISHITTYQLSGALIGLLIVISYPEDQS